MTDFIRQYETAIKYARGEHSPDLEALTKAVAEGKQHGDLLPVGVLADWIEERDHPLTPIVRQHWDEGRHAHTSYFDKSYPGILRAADTSTRSGIASANGHRFEPLAAYSVMINKARNGLHDVGVIVHHGPVKKAGNSDYQESTDFHAKLTSEQVKRLLHQMSADPASDTGTRTAQNAYQQLFSEPMPEST